MSGGPTRRADVGERRTTAEWVTFAVSAALLSIVVVALLALAVRSDDPATPVATVGGAVTERAGRYFVPVDLSNDGDVTATGVQVSAELTVDGEAITADQVVDFLGGGEDERLVFVFDTDPSEGELVVRVTGYTEP